MMPTRRSRSVSPLSPHGTTARAVGRPAQGVPGCLCTPCRDAKRAADKRRELMNATGRPVRVDAAPVAAHVRALLDAGVGWTRISAAASCSSSTLHRLLTGQKLIRRSVAERIVAVRRVPAPASHVDPTGTVRRLRALATLGYGPTLIAREAGVDVTGLFALRAGGQRLVRRSTAERIAAAYARLEQTVAPPSRWAARTRNAAEAAGWLGPVWWEPDVIDDPDFVPATGRTPRPLAVAEDVEFLTRAGLGTPLIAERLGMSLDVLNKNLERARKLARGRGAVAS